MAYAPRVRINPPLVITREQALEGIEILDEAMAAGAPRMRTSACAEPSAGGPSTRAR